MRCRDTLIIGHNEDWKQKINLGKRNNQNFVSVPYNRLIEMLSYKAEMVGIKVILTEESYTSASSFIDNDLIPVYKKGQKNQVSFSGKRIKRCSAFTRGFPPLAVASRQRGMQSYCKHWINQ
uniref:IS200/IS605 family accessory protein TnpB-related protein n=1 Tax=Okeania sp. SIO2F4 TaxID=2607790 RepID=UPI003422152C